jgi:hypothetical protein
MLVHQYCAQGCPGCIALQVLINGITVGDIASWMDSLLFAGLLRYGASAFAAVEGTTQDKQLSYTFVVRLHDEDI